MLVIRNQEYFDKVVAFAKQIGMYEQLKDRLDYLDTYACRDGEGNVDRTKTECRLSKDFAPYSFEFVLVRRNANGSFDYWFNGGLIFHGNHDNGGDGGAPTFAVNLSPEHGWSIHT
jgi:hypothetical protein